MNIAAAAKNLRRWREDPRAFVREVFGVTPDPWQDDVLAAFPIHNRIAMTACKGPGKSTLLAWTGWNFLLTRPHPKVVATSITGDNLRDGLWAEYAKWRHRSQLLQHAFEWTHTRIFSKDHPQTWFASARQWSKSADPGQQADTLAGIHGDYVYFQIDEAGGVPDSVASAAEASSASGIETKLGIAGNPTLLSGPLYRAATKDRHLWKLFEITGDPDDPKRAPRVSKQWAREQIEQHGREHPYVLVNVFGKFPPTQANKLLGINDISAATTRTVGERAFRQSPRVIGVDVAREGEDLTVFQPRQGLVAFQPRSMRIADGMEVASQLVKAVRDWKPHAVFVDMTGNGSGVVDRMRQLGYRVIGIQAGRTAAEKHRFQNRRCEMWWRMAQWVRDGGCLPNEPRLAADLLAPTYEFDDRGIFTLQSKRDLKDLGLPSPDFGDALAHTFWDHVAAPEFTPAGEEMHHHKVLHDWDPFAEGRV